MDNVLEKRNEEQRKFQVFVGQVKKLMDKGVTDIKTLMETTGKSRTMVERAVHAVENAVK